MVAERTGTSIFTCMYAYDETAVAVRAPDVTHADERTGQGAVILIQGRMKHIGARRVRRTPDYNRLVLGIPIRGDMCSLIIGDPIRIDDAVYEETVKINGAPYLRFRKNNTVFWTFEDETYFIRIGARQSS